MSYSLRLFAVPFRVAVRVLPVLMYIAVYLIMCVCVCALGLLTCICEIYIGFQITLSLRITLVSKAVFVSVFAYLIFALAVKFYHFIFFFIQQKSGFQQEIKCQTSEGVTEQQKLSQKELTKNIAWREKKKILCEGERSMRHH